MERAAILLANTVFAVRGRAGDAIRDAAGLGGWLAAHAGELPAAPPTIDGVALRRLRDATRELLAALAEERAPAGDALVVINRASRSGPTSPLIEWGAESPTLGLVPGAADGSEQFLACFARSAIELATGPHARDVLACRGPRCVQFVLRDQPRRAFCSEACSARARSARYYRRNRPAT